MNTITVTTAAAKQIGSQIAKRGSGIGLRVGLKPVGCSGFAYSFDFADEVRDDEQRIDINEATLVIANQNLAYFEGARLDFVRDGLKQSFRFDNPNVANACGCGESFGLKAGGGKGGTV